MGLVDLSTEAKVGYEKVSKDQWKLCHDDSLSLMLPSMDKRMLSDLISRWMTPFEWRCCNPLRVLLSQYQKEHTSGNVNPTSLHTAAI